MILKRDTHSVTLALPAAERQAATASRTQDVMPPNPPGGIRQEANDNRRGSARAVGMDGPGGAPYPHPPTRFRATSSMDVFLKPYRRKVAVWPLEWPRPV